MNEILPRHGSADDLAKARSIVARHAMPDFITSFDVRLGFMDEDPALFVIYRETPNKYEPRIDEVLRRSLALAELDRAVFEDLSEAFEDRIAYSLCEPERQIVHQG